MENKGREHPIAIMKNRYPQLMLPVKQDMSKSELYKRVALLGKPVPVGLVDYCFCFSDKDYITEETFSCGKTTIIYLYERGDFESFVQKTAYRCEPKEIPKSMGAITISGLNNWEIYNKDSLIVLSQGLYSSLEDTYTKFSAAEWLNKSIDIRKYHELTHFICRKKYYVLKNVLLDEIFADCMGLIMAVGKYEDSLAKLFLGIEGKEYKKGMRLENYISDGDDIQLLAEKARQFIHMLVEITEQMTADKAEFEKCIDCYYPKAASCFAEIFL